MKKVYKKQRAFTLMEILIAVAIVAIMGAIAGPAIYKRFAGAQLTATKQILEQTKQALELYYVEKGKYPTTKEGLSVLVPKYLELKKDAEGIVRDGWKQELEYNSPPVRYKNEFKSYEIISEGDRKSTDENKEIYVGS